MDTHIYYHDIEVPIITNLNTGDLLMYDGKSRVVTGFSYSYPLDTVFIAFGENEVSVTLLRDENPHLKVARYRTSVQDVKLYRQRTQTFAGETFAFDIYQFVYTLPNGVRYPMQPFTLRFLYELRLFVDWPMWEVRSLDNPVEVAFTLHGCIITKISDCV